MRKCAGFTLIELLVILAILVVLATVLFPVFAQARSTRTANHLSDLKRQETTVNLYSQDYDAVLLSNHSVTAAYFKAGHALTPDIGCSTEAADGSWQSLNGGCEDTISKLVWSRTSDETIGYYNRVWKRLSGDTRLSGAYEYCRDLAEGGFDDWRLPTNAEVKSAQSHLIANYVPMRYPATWRRWTNDNYAQGKTTYAYMVYLGTTQSPFSVIAIDNKGNYSNAGDTICVRTP